jgi:hypothetical protein
MKNLKRPPSKIIHKNNRWENDIKMDLRTYGGCAIIAVEVKCQLPTTEGQICSHSCPSEICGEQMTQEQVFLQVLQ